MGIVLARIDNRLLHGVVATQWAPKTRAQRVMVIDDETAGNEIAKSSMKPCSSRRHGDIDHRARYRHFQLQANKYDGQSIFLITKRVETIKRLMDEAGVEIPELDLGATAQRAITDGVIEVNARTTIDPDEAAAYRDLMARGVNVYVQYLLADKPNQWLRFLVNGFRVQARDI